MTSALFSNTQNIHINGGQFIQNNVNQRTIYLKGEDLLREYCALGALVDSNERFDPPRCSAETRRALIEEILAWIYGHDESASIAWLFGGAGAGKSALAQTIAEICRREGRLAGSFFFSRTSTADRSDGARLIPTLVFQLLEVFPDLKPHLKDVIDRHAGIFDRSPSTQMEVLYINPLKTLKQQAPTLQISPGPSMLPTPLIPATTTNSISRRYRMSKILRNLMSKVDKEPRPVNTSPPQPDISKANTMAGAPDLSQPRLVVIDGLDECNGEDVQINLLRVLASAMPHLPFPLRFLIVSRPEGGITRTIIYDETFKGLDVLKINLSIDANADEDIRRFLTKGFQEIHRTHPLRSFLSPSWPSEHVITIVVQKSSSHFIYASTVIKYVQYPRGRPDQRLKTILGLSVTPTTGNPFAQLDALYTYIFMCIDEPNRSTINHVLGLVYLAGRNTLIYEIETSPAKLEGYLGMQAGEMNILFEPLFSLVTLPEDREASIKVLHTSLFDFLLDQDRSGSLHLDPEMPHALLAKHWFHHMRTHTFDPSQLRGLSQKYKDPVDSCWRFLGHCYLGYLWDEPKEYLLTFPFLYEVILYPTFIPNYLPMFDSSRLIKISMILQTFFTLIVKKNFDNSLHWHSVHTTQVEQRLLSIYGDCDPCLRDDSDTGHEPLFNDVLYQSRHRVYFALFNVFFKIVGIKCLEIFLLDWSRLYGPRDIQESILSHSLVAYLPSMSSKDVDLCIRCSNRTGYFHNRGDELCHVLRQRVVQYLERVGKDLDGNKLKICKEAWGIE